MYFIGIGDFSIDQDAIICATKGLCNPKLILFTTARTHLTETTNLLNKMYPATQIIGGSGYALQKNSNSKNLIVVIGFGDDVEVVTGIIRETNICPVNSVGALCNHAEQIHAGIDDTVCFEMCTGDEESIVTLMNSVLDKRNIPMIGGTTFSWNNNMKYSPEISYNGVMYNNSCAYAFIRNKHGRIKVYREHFYQIPKDAPNHLVNKADHFHRVLNEMDNRRAADVYFDETGFHKNDILNATIYHPLGRVIGNEVFVFEISEIRDDGSFIISKRININDSIYILEIGDIRKSVTKTIDTIKSDMKHISFILTVNCAHRQRLFEQVKFRDEYCSMMNTLGPCAFFISGGEQGFGQHMNQSMVCMVFE